LRNNRYDPKHVSFPIESRNQKDSTPRWSSATKTPGEARKHFVGLAAPTSTDCTGPAVDDTRGREFLIHSHRQKQPHPGSDKRESVESSADAADPAEAPRRARTDVISGHPDNVKCGPLRR